MGFIKSVLIYGITYFLIGIIFDVFIWKQEINWFLGIAGTLLFGILFSVIIKK